MPSDAHLIALSKAFGRLDPAKVRQFLEAVTAQCVRSAAKAARMKWKGGQNGR